MSDNSFLNMQRNYSKLKNNFIIFEIALKSNKAYLISKSQELEKYLGINIIYIYILQNKFINLVWDKFNLMVNNKKNLNLIIEEKIIDKNDLLI